MNLPNKLTTLRMIMVPFFVFFMLTDFCGSYGKWICLALFCIASITDLLDGKIARARNLVTNFGKFMDPLADKILVMAALICFIALGHTNPYFVIIIMFREFAISAIRLVAASNGTVIAANIWGKAKTVTQIIAIIVVLVLQYVLQLGFFAESTALFHIIGECFNGLCTLMALISGIIYIKDNWKCISDF